MLSTFKLVDEGREGVVPMGLCYLGTYSSPKKKKKNVSSSCILFIRYKPGIFMLIQFVFHVKLFIHWCSTSMFD